MVGGKGGHEFNSASIGHLKRGCLARNAASQHVTRSGFGLAGRDGADAGIDAMNDLTWTELETVERILARMYRRRLPQYIDKLALPGWEWVRCGELRPQKPREIILGMLRNGRRVTAGYTTTGVRGFHEYYIPWKPKR
jgi:hypothetical protein